MSEENIFEDSAALVAYRIGRLCALMESYNREAEALIKQFAQDENPRCEKCGADGNCLDCADEETG